MINEQQVIENITELQLQKSQISPLWRIRHPRGNWIIYSKKIRNADIENVCRMAESLSLAQIDPYIWGKFTEKRLSERNSHPSYKQIGLLGITEEGSAPSGDVEEFLVEGFGKEYTLEGIDPNYNNLKVDYRILLLPKYTKLWSNPARIDFALISKEGFSAQHQSGLVETIYPD